MGKLKGKVAFVTGAARGMGRSHALRLAREGADIIALDICEQIPSVPYAMPDKAELAETATMVDAQGQRVVALQGDVRELPAIEDLLGDAVAQLGRLDIVVANAGIVSFGGTRDLDPHARRDGIDVNQPGVGNPCRAAIPHILAHDVGGSLVLISSTVALHGTAGAPHYVTAKTGLIGMMRSLALELGPMGIRVN